MISRSRPLHTIPSTCNNLGPHTATSQQAAYTSSCVQAFLHMTGRPESVALDWANAAHNLSLAHRSTGKTPQRCENADANISDLPSHLARVNLGAAPDVASDPLVPKWTGKEDEVPFVITASSTIQDVYLAISKGRKMKVAQDCSN